MIRHIELNFCFLQNLLRPRHAFIFNVDFDQKRNNFDIWQPEWMLILKDQALAQRQNTDRLERVLRLRLSRMIDSPGVGAFTAEDAYQLVPTEEDFDRFDFSTILDTF